MAAGDHPEFQHYFETGCTVTLVTPSRVGGQQPCRGEWIVQHGKAPSTTRYRTTPTRQVNGASRRRGTERTTRAAASPARALAARAPAERLSSPGRIDLSSHLTSHGCLPCFLEGEQVSVAVTSRAGWCCCQS